MCKEDLGSSSVLFLLGAAVAYGSRGLGLGTWAAPGPGFLPFLAGLGLALFATGIFALAIIKKEEVPAAEKFWPRPDSGKMVLSVFISLVVYDLLWTRLGFSLTTFLLLLFLFRSVGKRTWSATLVGAMIASLTSYFLFQVFLKSQLPTGFIGF